MYVRLLLVLAAVAAYAAPASAQPAGRCTREILSVQRNAVTAAYCVASVGPAAGHELPVRVLETYSSARGSVTTTETLRFIEGEPASRVIEDLSLDRLGLSGVLHLTLVLHAGLVRVDAAMLTPGAITIK
ncbi:MAG: hypothetical protein ABR508_02245 [Candidatus Baltobacteraceae bacterium]